MRNLSIASLIYWNLVYDKYGISYQRKDQLYLEIDVSYRKRNRNAIIFMENLRNLQF